MFLNIKYAIKSQIKRFVKISKQYLTSKYYTKNKKKYILKYKNKHLS